MELHNLMEDLVLQQIDDCMLQDTESYCKCKQCRLDVAAIALNYLSPRYVVTKRGETYSRAESLEIQRDVDVITAINKALHIVKNKPRHE